MTQPSGRAPVCAKCGSDGAAARSGIDQEGSTARTTAPRDAMGRRDTFMFALGAGYSAWRIAHQSVLFALALVVGITLGCWLIDAIGAWLSRHLRWHRITGDAGVVGIMAGKNGVSVGFYRRHVWLWKRPERASALAVDPSRSTPSETTHD